MPTFDATDFDNPGSEDGTAHEATTHTDHDNADRLKQGYDIANPYLSADLVGYWPLQEDSGSTAYDFSGNNYDGTINGATVNVEGLLGTSTYSFDGTDDYVDFGTIDFSATFDSRYTISMWFYFNTVSSSSHDTWFSYGGYVTDGCLIQKEGSTGNNRLRFAWDGESFVDVTDHSISAGKWVHTAIVVSDTALEDIYWNGSVTNLDKNIFDSPFFTSSQDTEFGRRTGSTSQYFDCRISDVRIYDRALSASEIQTLYDVVATKGDLTTQFKGV